MGFGGGFKSGGGSIGEDLKVSGSVNLTEVVEAGENVTAPSDGGVIYAKKDGSDKVRIYWKSSNVAEVDLTQTGTSTAEVGTLDEVLEQGASSTRDAQVGNLTIVGSLSSSLGLSGSSLTVDGSDIDFSSYALSADAGTDHNHDSAYAPIDSPAFETKVDVTGYVSASAGLTGSALTIDGNDIDFSSYAASDASFTIGSTEIELGETQNVIAGVSQLTASAIKLGDNVGDLENYITALEVGSATDVRVVEESSESQTHYVMFGSASAGSAVEINANSSLTYKPDTGALSASIGEFEQITGSLKGEVSSISNFDTDDLSEGSSNQYYTDTRARGAVGADSDLINYNSSTGEFTTNTTNFSASWDVKFNAENISTTYAPIDSPAFTTKVDITGPLSSSAGLTGSALTIDGNDIDFSSYAASDASFTVGSTEIKLGETKTVIAGVAELTASAINLDSEDLQGLLDGKEGTLTFDDAPTENSNNPVKSDGVFDALAGKQDSGDYALLDSPAFTTKVDITGPLSSSAGLTGSALTIDGDDIDFSSYAASNASFTIGSTEIELGETQNVIAGVAELTASAIQVTNLDVVTINSVSQTETTLEIDDKLIISAVSASSTDASGGGLQIGGGQDETGHASILWDNTSQTLKIVSGSVDALHVGTSVSSSLNISASAFYGDGSGLTNIGSDSHSHSDYAPLASPEFTTKVDVTGYVSASAGLTGSALTIDGNDIDFSSYAADDHNHDSDYATLTGATFTGNVVGTEFSASTGVSGAVGQFGSITVGGSALGSAATSDTGDFAAADATTTIGTTAVTIGGSATDFAGIVSLTASNIKLDGEILIENTTTDQTHPQIHVKGKRNVGIWLEADTDNDSDDGEYDNPYIKFTHDDEGNNMGAIVGMVGGDGNSPIAEGSSGTLYSDTLENYFLIGGTYSHTSDYGVQIGTKNAVRMTIEGGGNVGIGKTDPGCELDVDGAIAGNQITGSDGVSGSLGLFTTITASYISASHIQATDLTLAADSLTIGDYTLTASEMAYLDGVVAGVGQANKALVLSADGEFSDVSVGRFDELYIGGKRAQITKWSLANIVPSFGDSDAWSDDSTPSAPGNWNNNTQVWTPEFTSSNGLWQVTASMQVNLTWGPSHPLAGFDALANIGSDYSYSTQRYDAVTTGFPGAADANTRWLTVGRDARGNSYGLSQGQGWMKNTSWLKCRIPISNLGVAGAGALRSRVFTLTTEIRNLYSANTMILSIKGGANECLETNNYIYGDGSNAVEASEVGVKSFNITFKDDLADSDYLTFFFDSGNNTNALAFRVISLEEVISETSFVTGDVDINGALDVPSGSSNLKSIIHPPNSQTISNGKLVLSSSFARVTPESGQDPLHTIMWDYGDGETEPKDGQILYLQNADQSDFHVYNYSSVSWSGSFGSGNPHDTNDSEDVLGANITVPGHYQSFKGKCTSMQLIYQAHIAPTVSGSGNPYNWSATGMWLMVNYSNNGC